MAEVFHPGEQAAQTMAGVRERMAAGGGRGIRDFMPDQHRQFFSLLRYLFVAVPDEAAGPIATLLTGAPRFVDSPDERSLDIAALPHPDDPAAVGFVAGAAVGLLGIDLATRRRNRANGTIAGLRPGGLSVAVTQSFGNCAQYIQRRLDRPHPAARGRTTALGTLDAAAQALIQRSDTVFVASGTPSMGLDMSHRGGRPGFIHVDGDVLTVPDFAGNRFFNTLGNLLLDPRASLLVPDFTNGDLLQLQGRVTIGWNGGDFPSAQRLWRMAVTAGWRTRNAIPFDWTLLDVAPTTEATGVRPDPSRQLQRRRNQAPEAIAAASSTP